jgi:transposase
MVGVTNMASIADWCCFVGFDYHDCFVQVCVLDAAGEVLGNQRVANDTMSIFEYVDKMRDGRVVRGAAIETCCGASHFAEQVRKHDWPVELAHAGICSKMKQSPDKSDLADAHLLADLCRVGYLPRVWLPPLEIRDLRRLGRYRQQLVEQRRDVKLRIRAMLREERIAAPQEAGNVWTKAWLAWLKSTESLDGHSRWVMDQHLEDLERLVSQVRKVERRMEEATADDPVVQKLCETKGVGLVTAVVMRAEIGSFDRFACGKQLARYCAVTPKNVSSGKRQADGGLVKAGNLTLRTMLIEAAHRLARYQPTWKQMKEDLKKRGKPASVAAAAVANRWIRKLFWEMRQVEQQSLAA